MRHVEAQRVASEGTVTYTLRPTDGSGQAQITIVMNAQSNADAKFVATVIDAKFAKSMMQEFELNRMTEEN